MITELTQMQLAEKLGVSQSLVSKWFSGKVIPRPKTILKICKATGTSYQDFINFIYEKNKILE